MGIQNQLSASTQTIAFFQARVGTNNQGALRALQGFDMQICRGNIFCSPFGKEGEAGLGTLTMSYGELIRNEL